MSDRTLEEENAELRRRLEQAEETIRALRRSDSTRAGSWTWDADVTASTRAEQALRENEQRFRRMADALPAMIWVSDVSKSCTWFNQCWLDFCGRPMEALIGDGWAQDVHPDDLARCLGDYAKQFDARQPFALEYRLRRRDGEYRWVQDNGIPWFDTDGAFVGYIGSCVDFTDRKLAEEKLRVLALDLAEVGRRKDQFLAMLGHELRNPLAPIHNAVQLLRLANASPQRVQAATGMLERQVGQMVRLVDDLLDVNRIGRGKIELRRARTELTAIVKHAVEAARPLPQWSKRELSISVPPQPIFVDGDPTRLGQIIGNLLSNACKFTEPGGRVRVTVERDGEEAVLHVRDDGIGIAADQLPRIFDMFAQVDSSLQRTQSGLGIGLTLVRSLVELHGGTVQARSRGIGHGSEFSVRLAALPDAQMGSALGRQSSGAEAELRP